MNAILARISDEPVLAVTLVEAVITCAVSFGLPITKEQAGAITLVAIALLNIVARNKVTPA